MKGDVIGMRSPSALSSIILVALKTQIQIRCLFFSRLLSKTRDDLKKAKVSYIGCTFDPFGIFIRLNLKVNDNLEKL